MQRCCCNNTNVTAYWLGALTQASAIQSFSADVSRLWIMTYCWSLGAAQSTVTSAPRVTPTIVVPQTVYEVVTTGSLAVGKAVGNPTWKLFKPFTAAVQTKCLMQFDWRLLTLNFTQIQLLNIHVNYRVYVRISQATLWYTYITARLTMKVPPIHRPTGHLVVVYCNLAVMRPNYC